MAPFFFTSINATFFADSLNFNVEVTLSDVLSSSPHARSASAILQRVTNNVRISAREKSVYLFVHAYA